VCMNTLHTKSPCCKSKIHKFGTRRRQCSYCKKTWRVRQKKRGRKPIRVHPSIKRVAFASHETLRHRAIRYRKGRELIRRRHAANVSKLMHKLPSPKAPRGQLIAVVDGKHFCFNRKSYTLYQILLRPVHKNFARIMDPVFLPGHETSVGWEQAFDFLPESTRQRIVAVVSDGIYAIERIGQKNGWIIQRCHFHLLKTLQGLRGKRWSTVSHKQLRETIYNMVREALDTSDDCRAQQLHTAITKIVYTPHSPQWFALRVRGFLRRFDRFRSYHSHPDLNLPRTTNSAESVFNQISYTIHQTRGFRTLESCQRWLTIQIRTMSDIRCNGHNFLPK